MKTIVPMMAVILLAGALRAETGVTASEVLVGQSAAFQGPAAALGTELWRGAQACFDRVNKDGGVNGRRIKVLAVDDSYEGNKTLPNTLKLINESKVFALFDYVGTPTLVQALPAIQRYRGDGVFLFGAFSGAQPQREEPFKDSVFNIRASYRQETAALVDAFVKDLGLNKIGVFIQGDPYGRSGLDGVQRALKAHGLAVAAETTYQRNVPYETSMTEQVKLLQAAGVQAVVAVGAYTQCAAFIRDARAAGYKGWIANLSFVGPDALLGLLKQEGAKGGSDLTANLVNTQVVPAWSDASVGVVRDYLAAMDASKPQLPSDLADASYKPVDRGFGSLEGYINARMFVEVLKAVPGELTRAKFYAAATKVQADLGGFKLHFDPETHQASNKVFFTRVQGGAWVPVKSLKGAQ